MGWHLNRQPVIWMIGELRKANGGIFYYEWMYNRDKGNVLLMHSASQCRMTPTLPQPTSQAPAEPTQPYVGAGTHQRANLYPALRAGLGAKGCHRTNSAEQSSHNCRERRCVHANQRQRQRADHCFRWRLESSC